MPGITTDHAGQPRVMGGIPDVGPHEYYTTDIKGSLPPNALPRVINYSNPAQTRIELNVAEDIRQLIISDVTGRTAAVLKVRNGQAILKPEEHGMRDGMYLLRTGNGDAAGKLILTK